MRFACKLGLLAMAVGFAVNAAHAQTLNDGPPTAPANGSKIFDLANPSQSGMPSTDSTPTLSTYDSSTGGCTGGTCAIQNYSVNFSLPQPVAGEMTLTFAFRNDPGYFAFSNVSLTASNSGATQLLANGNFDQNAGTISLNYAQGQTAPDYRGCPVGVWCGFYQYVGQSGSPQSNGSVSDQPSGSGLSWAGTGTTFWQDGATQQYDGVFQNITLPAADTAGGTTFTLTFSLENINVNSSDSPFNTSCTSTPVDETSYQQTSTNGQTGAYNYCGNGVDVVGYAGFPGLPTPNNYQAPPTGAPEPASLVLMGSGLLGLGLLRRYHRS